MWFKNLLVYQLQDSLHLTRQQLEDKLSANCARPCGKLERMTFGWVAPVSEESEELVCEVGGYLMVAAKKIEKILPAQVVKDHVKEKIAAIEQEQARKVGGKERRNLLDEAALSLLPRAFEKSSTIYAYFDLKNQWLLVDSSNKVKAEELSVLLRTSLGSFKITPLKTVESIKFTLTKWLQHDEVPSDFTIDETCEMQDQNSAKTIIKCMNQNLYTDEVKAHLLTGKLITQLALTFSDRVSFVLDEYCLLKRIRFLDLVQDQLEDYQPETVEEGFKANFAIFATEFAVLLPLLINAFGGVEKELMQEHAEVLALA